MHRLCEHETVRWKKLKDNDSLIAGFRIEGDELVVLPFGGTEERFILSDPTELDRCEGFVKVL